MGHRFETFSFKRSSICCFFLRLNNSLSASHAEDIDSAAIGFIGFTRENPAFPIQQLID